MWHLHVTKGLNQVMSACIIHSLAHQYRMQHQTLCFHCRASELNETLAAQFGPAQPWFYFCAQSFSKKRQKYWDGKNSSHDANILFTNCLIDWNNGTWFLCQQFLGVLSLAPEETIPQKWLAISALFYFSEYFKKIRSNGFENKVCFIANQLSSSFGCNRNIWSLLSLHVS